MLTIREIGKKIILTDGKDRYVTESKKKAMQVISEWLYGERLPTPSLR